MTEMNVTTSRQVLRERMLRAYDDKESLGDAVKTVERLLARTRYSGQPRKVVWKTRLGWPLELFKGRPITNAIRIILHARSRGPWYDQRADPSNPPRPGDPTTTMGPVR